MLRLINQLNIQNKILIMGADGHKKQEMQENKKKTMMIKDNHNLTSKKEHV